MNYCNFCFLIIFKYRIEEINIELKNLGRFKCIILKIHYMFTLYYVSYILLF